MFGSAADGQVAVMIPNAIGRVPGAGARASMAQVIIGGQMFSLLLALLVTPVFYSLFDSLANLAGRLGIRFSVKPSTANERTVGPAHSGPSHKTDSKIGSEHVGSFV